MAISPIIKSSLISKICIGFLAPIAFLLSSVSAAADQQTADAQSLLNNLGYNAGAVDGAWGKKPALLWSNSTPTEINVLMVNSMSKNWHF